MGNMSLPGQFQYGINPSLNIPSQLMGNNPLLSNMNKGPIQNVSNQQKSTFNPSLLNANMMGWNTGFPGQGPLDKGMNQTKKDDM